MRRETARNRLARLAEEKETGVRRAGSALLPKPDVV